MISINEKNFSRSKEKILKDLSMENHKIGNSRKLEEIRNENGSIIEQIKIEATCGDIKISVSNSSEVVVHLYGEVENDEDVNFDVRVINQELRIILKIKENYVSRNLKLDITIPKKKFKLISASSISANFILEKDVLVESLKVTNQLGNFVTKATFNEVYVSSVKGSVEIFISAVHNITIVVSTMDGDVSIELNNIAHMDLLAKSMNGYAKNFHKCDNGYNADLYISTIRGDIKIK